MLSSCDGRAGRPITHADSSRQQAQPMVRGQGTAERYHGMPRIAALCGVRFYSTAVRLTADARPVSSQIRLVLTHQRHSACVTAVTDDHVQPEHAELAPAVVAKSSRLRSLVEWFWLGGLLARRRAALPASDARATVLAQRAQQCVELARDLSSSGDEGEGAPRLDVGELYRQAAYWALCAIGATEGRATDNNYSEATWALLDDSLLVRAAGHAERVQVLKNALYSGSFVYFAELPQAEERQLSAELQKLAELLISRFRAREHSIHAVYLQRAWRLGLIALAGLAVFIGLYLFHESRELASGKPWRESSQLPGYGCESPLQQCANSPGLFFHTNQEKAPWIEFDLGAEHSVSLVKVENRVDCCFDRAVPLTVEVSTDHQHWKTVARRDEVFSEWVASFQAVPARWVRLRAHKETWLHLNRVRIFP